MASRRWMLLKNASMAVGFLLTVWMRNATASKSPDGNLFFRQCDGEPCGLFGFAFAMHRGTPGSDDCEEVCVLFPFLRLGSLECGVCNPETTKFDVTLRFNDIPAEDEVFFTEGKDLWETVITGDISDRKLAWRAPKRCNYPKNVDDVVMCASYSDIDGPGRVLGSASPDLVRNIGADAGLPLTGTMQFDKADIASMKTRGTLGPVIKHEMAHILGIGTLWLRFGAAGFELLDCPYKGSNANREYRALTGCNSVPVEDEGGGGTACSHWDERCLRSELMTGSPTRGDNPLSRVTIASLADIGYSVDYSAAGNYTRDNVNKDCICDQSWRHRRNGESLLLGANRTRSRRRLSDEGRQIAVDYGQAILQERTLTNSLLRSDSTSGSSRDDDGLLYLGDQVIAVLVEDGGEIYGMVVCRMAKT